MLGTTLVIKNYIMNVQYAMQLLNLFCNYQNLDPVKVFFLDSEKINFAVLTKKNGLHTSVAFM